MQWLFSCVIITLLSLSIMLQSAVLFNFEYTHCPFLCNVIDITSTSPGQVDRSDSSDSSDDNAPTVTVVVVAVVVVILMIAICSVLVGLILIRLKRRAKLQLRSDPSSRCHKHIRPRSPEGHIELMSLELKEKEREAAEGEDSSFISEYHIQ